MVAFARLWCEASGQRLFAGMVVVGVCSPLVLVWLVGVRRFLAFGVRSAFVRWCGGGWRLFAFGFPVVPPCLLAG